MPKVRATAGTQAKSKTPAGSPSRKNTATTATQQSKGWAPKGGQGAATPASDGFATRGRQPKKPVSPGGGGGGAGGNAQLDSLIDGAKNTLRVKLDSINDTDLVNRLSAAAQRGVNVQVYLPEDKPADGASVLAEQGLEAAGVDVMVDRGDHVPGGLGVADGQALILNGAAPQLTSDPSATKQLADAFAAAMKEAPPSRAGLGMGPEQVRLFPMPDSGASQIAGAINGAKSSVDLEVYQLQDREVIDSLKQAAARGVQVRVMLEPKPVGGASNYNQVSAELKAAGVQVQATPPQFDASHNVDHAKFMVLDAGSSNPTLLYGSGNLVRSGLGGNPAGEFDNRDFWIGDTRAQSASEASSLFNADWKRQSTSGIQFKNLVVTPDNADQRVLDLINGSKSRCYVYNQELKDPKVIQSLIAAKQRGVDVQVLLGFQPGFGSAPAPNQPALDQLKQAGIPAEFYTGHYLHGKAIVSDAQAFIGSQNFTSGGLQNNRELGEILNDPTAVNQLVQIFQSDERNPTPS